uniref:Uncharacterized protein n=1 Tax=Rhizophora mucronata TaxID=61149 RepID=A0A2P2NX17_RHIMU
MGLANEYKKNLILMT